MDLKKETLQSILKVSKEKLIFIFCSGLLLFILSLPGDSDSLVRQTSNMEAGITAADSGPGWDMTENGNGTADSGVAAGSSKASQAANSYEAELESRIRDILAGVEGVGEVDVMVVLKSSEEKVIRVDKSTSTSTTEEKNEGGQNRTIIQQDQSESTVMDGASSSPVIEKELKPELSGIVISADGGGSAVVKAEISEAMEALFGLPSHKIKVLKRVKEGV